jgi:hypothetical protein
MGAARHLPRSCAASRSADIPPSLRTREETTMQLGNVSRV